MNIPLSFFQSHPPFANSHFFKVGGILLHGRDWRPPDGTPCRGKILLVHGLGGSTFSWDSNAAELARAGYFTLAADLPGFGYSSRQPGLDHSQENRARLLWLLLRELDDLPGTAVPAGRWLLTGHSMGAGCVAAMALAEPERTAGLVWVDGALLNLISPLASRLAALFPAAWLMRFTVRALLTTRLAVRRFLGDALGRRPSPGQLLEYSRALQVAGTSRAMVDMVRTSTNVPIGGLNRFPRPIFAIWGSEDRWIPASAAAGLKQLVPQTDVRIIAGAAHAPMESHPGPFNDMMLDMAGRIFIE